MFCGTHLLLLLAFGLLLSWIWYGDVQRSLQGRQVLTVEGSLTAKNKKAHSSGFTLACELSLSEGSEDLFDPGAPGLVPSGASAAHQSSEGKTL